MTRFAVPFVTLVLVVSSQAQIGTPRSGDELVSTVLDNCADVSCVKLNVLGYLDNILNIQTDVRNAKNIDAAIFKRAARVLNTHEFKLKVPEVLLENTEIVYNPQNGFDIHSDITESRGMGLKKKLLLPILLLFKLKMKLLMPIFVALIGLKAMKALILSKLAIVLVLGFIVYTLCTKAGMPMPMMSMAPTPPSEPPAPLYGAPPAPSPAPPSSYEPGWEPNQGGPYSRIWSSNNNDAQNLAYSAYYPGTQQSSTSSP